MWFDQCRCIDEDGGVDSNCAQKPSAQTRFVVFVRVSLGLASLLVTVLARTGDD